MTCHGHDMLQNIIFHDNMLSHYNLFSCINNYAGGDNWLGVNFHVEKNWIADKLKRTQYPMWRVLGNANMR